MEGNGSYKKSPHDTDLKSKDNRGSLWGALEDTSTQLSRSVLNTAKDAQEVSSDASIAQESVKNKCQLERTPSVACGDSSPKETPYGDAAKFPATAKAVPLGKVA